MSKTWIFSILSLGSGFGAGYLVGHKFAKTKYLKIADKEINSVKESLTKYYEDKKGTPCVEGIKADGKDILKTEEKPNLPIIDKDSIDYDKLKNVEGANEEKAYRKYTRKYKSKETEKEEKPDEEPLIKPYVITPDEFAGSEYDVKSLTYYADGVLADDEYNVIKDIKGYVGDEALNSFGVYEDDVVYVRNDKYRIDYEILLDEREYKKVALKGVTTEFPGDDD